MKPIAACIFVVYFLMIFASLVRFYVFVMPPGGSKMLAVDVSIVPYQWLGRSPSYHEVLTPVQLLLRLQNHHHHTQAVTTTTPQMSLAMDQEEKKQVQSIRDQLKGHSFPDGGEILGSINLSSSEFTATNNRAHIVRRYESGSTASERKTTRETPDRKGLTFSLFSLEDLLQYFVRKLINAVSEGILLAIHLLCSKVSGLVSVCILLAIHLLCSKVSQPSASQHVEIVERIPVSSSDFAATIDNRQYPTYYATFNYSNEETRKRPEPAAPPKAPEKPKEQEKPKVPKKIKLAKGKRRVTLQNLQRYFGHKRKDAAASLGVSVSTLKRDCRKLGIMKWPTGMGSSAISKPPNQYGERHGERNTSTAREMPSHNVQTMMEGELFGQNEVANVFRQDFMEGPIALHTESGLIMVSRPPDQHGERNTSTACGMSSCNVETGMEIEPIGQNQEANVFRRDSTEGPIALNTENGLIIGSSSEWASHVNDQSTLSTPYQNHNALVFPQPQITSILSENRGGSIDWRNSLASQAEPFSDTHISGFSNLAFPTWSDQAALSQHAEGQSVQSTVYPDHNAVHRFPERHVFESTDWNEHTNSLASQAEPFSDRLISKSIWRPPEGQTMQFTTHPNPNALALPQFQIASSQVPSANKDGINSLASQVEAFFMGHVSESSNLAFPEYSDATAPSQPVATILTERQDIRSVKVKATYRDDIIKFQLPLTSGIKELMQEVSKTLDCELGSFNVDYKDEDGDWILMARDDNVSEYLQLLTSLGNQATKLKVRDKVPNTTNICETYGSLEQQRQ